MNIQQIAAEKAEEKYPEVLLEPNPDIDNPDDYNHIMRLSQGSYISGFLDCLQHLSGSEGDIKDMLQRYSDNPHLNMVKLIQELLATHTAKVANREWVCTVDGMPERLPERRTDEDSHCSINVFVSDYCDQVYEAYWDFDKNVWRYYDSDEALYDIIAWINKPFNNQPPKSPTPQD